MGIDFSFPPEVEEVRRRVRDFVEREVRPASDRLASAEAALEQARNFDRAGQESQCMDTIARAKQLVR